MHDANIHLNLTSAWSGQTWERKTKDGGRKREGKSLSYISTFLAKLKEYNNFGTFVKRQSGEHPNGKSQENRKKRENRNSPISKEKVKNQTQSPCQCSASRQWANIMSMTSHKWLLKTKTDINAVNPVRVSDNYGHYSLRKPSIDFLESVIFASQEASNEKVTAWSFFLSIDCMAVFFVSSRVFFPCCLWNEGEVSKQKGKLLDSISSWSVQRAPYPLCVWRLNCPLHAPRPKAQEKERRKERKAKEMSAIKRYKSKHSLLASVQHLTNELTSCPRPDSNGSWSTNQTAMLSTW